MEVIDFFLAVYLLTSHQELTDIQIQGREEIFLFPDTDEARRLKEAYESGTARVDPRAYAESIVHLKGLIAEKKS